MPSNFKNSKKKTPPLNLGNHTLKTPTICASITGKTLDSIKLDLKKAKNLEAKLVELRIDKLENTSDWKNLNIENIPIIVTNRSKKEGGLFKGSESERIESLSSAINSNVDCIDIEFSTSENRRKSIIESAKSENVSVIISYHDFEKVPSEKELLDKAKKMSKTGCDIVKVIGFSNSLQDSLNMLKFLIKSQKEIDMPVIAFAMGEKGRFTRFTAPLLGSPFTYASVKEKTAPGQLDIQEIKKILDKYN